MLLWSPPSSLLTLGRNPAPTHQPARTSTGTPQAKQIAGWAHSPTHKETGCIKTLEPTVAPGHGHTKQRAQELTPHASVQALDLGVPEACSQRHWDPDLSTSGKAPDTGKLQPHSLLWQDPAHWPAGKNQPWDWLGSHPICQLANTSFGIPWALKPDSRTWLCCQWASTNPRTWLHPLVGRHQPWDLLDPYSTHQ